MRMTRLVLLAGMLTLCGCRLVPIPHPVQLYTSDHTIQELCDFPKQFFLKHYNLAELAVKPARSRPIASKIDYSAECQYDNPDNFVPSFGYVIISPETEYSKRIPEGSAVRTMTVDGVVVTEIELPLGERQDPNIAQHVYVLKATIDGWEGDLSFKGGDEQARSAGAPVLVDMIRKLKGTPNPPTSYTDDGPLPGPRQSRCVGL